MFAPTVTPAEVVAYVGVGADNAIASACLTEAVALVVHYVGPSGVPLEIMNRAVLEVSAELYHKRKAPNGIAQYATPDAQPVRVARDPMVAAYPILNRFLPGGFA